MKSGQIVADKKTQVFSLENLKTNCSRRGFYERTTMEFTGMSRLLGMTAPQNSPAVTDVALHSMHWKGYQSKLLVVHLKGDLCNF